MESEIKKRDVIVLDFYGEDVQRVIEVVEVIRKGGEYHAVWGCQDDKEPNGKGWYVKAMPLSPNEEMIKKEKEQVKTKKWGKFF